MKSNKKFAISMLIFVCVFSGVIYWKLRSVYILAIFLVLICASLLCFINEKFAYFFKNILEKIADKICQFAASVSLTIIYAFAIIPTKLIMKIAKRDRLRINKYQKESYWIKVNEEDNNNLKQYELQY